MIWAPNQLTLHHWAPPQVGLLHCQVISCCKCPSFLQRSNLDLGVNNSNSLTWFADRCPYNCHHSRVRSHHPAWFEQPRSQWLTNHSGTCGSKAELPRADSTFIWILPSSSWNIIARLQQQASLNTLPSSSWKIIARLQQAPLNRIYIP